MDSQGQRSKNYSPYLKTPSIVAEERIAACRCNCNIDFFDPCATCPQKKWGPFCCYKTPDQAILQPPSAAAAITQPSLAKMLKSAAFSAAAWAKKGFAHADEETLKTRLETCSGCEFWNPKGFHNTGRCMKCGCSTWAKLRMATEKCPIGKW